MPRHRRFRAGAVRGWLGVIILLAASGAASPALADISGVQPGSATISAGQSAQATVAVRSSSGACLSGFTADVSVSISFAPACGSGAWISVMTVATTAATLQTSHLITITETPNLVGLSDLAAFALTVTAPPEPSTTTTTTTLPGASTTSPTTTTTTALTPTTTSGPGASSTTSTAAPAAQTSTTALGNDIDRSHATVAPPTTSGPPPGSEELTSAGPLSEAADGLFEGPATERAGRLVTSPWLILRSVLSAMVTTGLALVPFLVAVFLLAALATYRYLQSRRSLLR